ncbi:unnamed protein product [Meganyctiphanes norvegica]|uniref:Uncharacterized protein n=1 Tax=Meganyctiphanes norvegica TaxID=48144 RepID=A0AAV2SNM0_MEGNR
MSDAHSMRKKCKSLNYFMKDLFIYIKTTNKVCKKILKPKLLHYLILTFYYIGFLIGSENHPYSPKKKLFDLKAQNTFKSCENHYTDTGGQSNQVKLVSTSVKGEMFARHMEMSMDKFYTLLHQLEKAKASMDYLKLM